MKNKQSILKKEIDIANLSVSIFPTIAFIIIFAFAFSVSVFGEYYTDNGFDLIHSMKVVTTGALNLSYLDLDYYITFIGGLLISMWNFSFLLNKNYARAVLLQPKKRSDIFNKKAYLSLTVLALIVIVIKIIALFLNIKYNSGLSSGYIPSFIADTLVSLTLLFWGFMCGAAGTILAKRKIEAVIGSISLALLPNAIVNIFNFVATAFLRGYVFYDFYNFYYESMHISMLPPYESHEKSIIQSVLCILVSIAGLILIKVYFEKHYKFEDCGMVNKNKFITFVSGFSLPVVLSSVMDSLFLKIIDPRTNVINIGMDYRNESITERLTPDEPFILLAVFIGVSIILSLVFNVIITVKILNIKEKAKPIIAILGSAVVISVLCLTGGLGYENKLPDIENIEKIELQAPYDLFENTEELIGIADYYDISEPVLRECNIEITDSEDFETVLDIHSVVLADKNQETTEGIKFSYELKNGSTIVRSYRYISKESAEEILRLWNTKAVKEAYELLLTEKTLEYDGSYGSTFWSEQVISMDGFVYLQSKDAVLTSLTDVLSENEIKELKAAIYKDVTSLAHYEWFKPTESYGLLQFTRDELTKESLPFVMSSHSVSFQVTKEMTNTVEFLKAHDLMKFFKITREPVKAFLVDANKLGEYNKNFMQGVDVYGASMDYPMLHRMMFAAETSVSENLYFKDSEPMFKINEPWCKELTAEEYKEYMKKSHIKYFSGEGGTLLVVAYPESNCASALMVAEN